MKSGRPSPTDPASEDADRITTYAETVLRFGQVGALEIDLRRPLTPEDRAALALYGDGGDFGVVTAFNPGGRVQGAEDNRRANESLAHDLSSRGFALQVVEGMSPDGSHREPGYAVVSTEEGVVEIARRYRQVAVFWYDGRRFWIVGVERPLGRVALPIGD
jgi:hypothetical protein